MANLIIGCGTGRCGTTSISSILARQPGFVSYHEFSSLPWKSDFRKMCNLLFQLSSSGQPEIKNPIHHLNTSELIDSGGDFDDIVANLKDIYADLEIKIVDTAWYWINYVDWLVKIWPDIRIFCLVRNRMEMVDSWERMLGERNPWRENEAFPQYGDIPRMEASSKYWEEYAWKALEYCGKYPKNFEIFHFPEFLNNSEVQYNLLKFIGIDNPIMSEAKLSSSIGRDNAGNVLFLGGMRAEIA